MGLKVEKSRFWITLEITAYVPEGDVMEGLNLCHRQEKNGVSAVARLGVIL